MSSMSTSIHHRRRWYYALWALLLAGAGAALAWWETPARAGTAQFTLRLQVLGMPAGTQAEMWTGATRDWEPRRVPADPAGPRAEPLTLGPRSLPIAHRRLGQGLLLRRTHDLAVVTLRTPAGERRSLVYDLREDLASVLTIGKRLTVELTCRWEQLPVEPMIPADEKRQAIGH